LDEELTAVENLLFHAVLYNLPPRARKRRISEVLELVELADKGDRLVKTFSGGMKRRLEIARGLMHQPEILFLDEPTLGLDPQTRNHMWSYIEKLNREHHVTVFFTTHYMEEADKIAQRIAVIDHGKIVAEGSSRELREKTKTKTLEEAFLKLTGSNIRDEEATPLDHLRMRRQAWRGRR
jgi:ABC-2 type transport system ATP-binding protein